MIKAQAFMEAIAGLLSPGFKYWVESLAGRRSERRDIVFKWETELLEPGLYFDFTAEQQNRAASVAVHSEHGVVSPDEAVRRLARTTTFATLEPYLSVLARSELDKFKKDRTIYVISGAMDSCVRAIIAREIQRIKKSWKLI